MDYLIGPLARDQWRRLREMREDIASLEAEAAAAGRPVLAGVRSWVDSDELEDVYVRVEYWIHPDGSATIDRTDEPEPLYLAPGTWRTEHNLSPFGGRSGVRISPRTTCWYGDRI